MNLRKFNAGLLIILFTLCSSGSASPSPTGPFDRFGDIQCEDEMARLDNFAIQLQRNPSAKGLMIFYGGQRFRGRLPKRGEGAARAARLKPYLVQRRGIPADRVIVIDGGYAKEWYVEIWIIPVGVGLVSPNPTVPANQIKFRKGKARPRDFRCEI